MGEPLTITDLAHDLGLSATPIREALSRLAGEGLIEDRRGRGYFAPRIDVADLVELYGLRRLYLSEALTGMAPHGGRDVNPPPSHDETGEDLSEAIVRFFEGLVAKAGNRALFEAYRQITDRLAPIVRVEARVFDLRADVSSLNAACSQNPQALNAAIDTLHRERQIKSGELVRALRATANIATL